MLLIFVIILICNANGIDYPKPRNTKSNAEFSEIRMNNAVFDVVQFLKRIIFSEEATYKLNASVNLYNTRYWSDKTPYWMLKGHAQHLKKINVWAGIIDSQIRGPYLIEGGNITKEENNTTLPHEERNKTQQPLSIKLLLTTSKTPENVQDSFNCKLCNCPYSSSFSEDKCVKNCEPCNDTETSQAENTARKIDICDLCLCPYSESDYEIECVEKCSPCSDIEVNTLESMSEIDNCAVGCTCPYNNEECVKHCPPCNLQLITRETAVITGPNLTRETEVITGPNQDNSSSILGDAIIMLIIVIGLISSVLLFLKFNNCIKRNNYRSTNCSTRTNQTEQTPTSFFNEGMYSEVNYQQLNTMFSDT